MLVMAELSSLDNETSYVSKDHIQNLEALIDSFDAILPPLNHFIIPGENQGAAALDLARTTTRRAERQVLRLSRKEKVREEVLIVLNRLSDLCFVLSRIESTKDES
jgi:cob(I)alamin adenosyltransferase